MIVFSFDYPPRDGGIARLSSEIVSAAAAAGVAVEVLTQSSELSGLSVPGVPTDRVNPERPRRELAALMRVPSWRDAVVVSGIWYPEGLLAALGQPRFHAILAHGMELMPAPSPLRRRLWSTLQRRTLEGAQVVVANSRYTAEWVRRTAPEAVVEVVPLAVDATRFTPVGREAERGRRGWGGKQVVLTVSRLSGYKAHDTVLRALAQLPSEARGDLRYAIAGRGPAEASLRALAEELGVASMVEWLGFVPESELASLYAASDLFVLLTREREATREVEGFGLVFLEAQACGTAVLGARTGGIPDAVAEGEGGWLIAADDEAGLGVHLRALVTSPEAVRAEGARGRVRVLRDCSWEGYWQAFRAVLNRHGAGL